MKRTNNFFIISTYLFLIFWIFCSTPLILRHAVQLINYLTNPPLITYQRPSFIWTLVSPVGEGKLKYFTIAGIVIFSIIFFLWIKYFKNKGLFNRSLILLIVLTCQLLTLSWVKNIGFDMINDPYESINDIVIVTPTTVDYQNIFNIKNSIYSIKNFHVFYKLSYKKYTKYSSHLSQVWGIPKGNKLKSIFFMNLISRLWGYGNVNNPEATGCVLDNENEKTNQMNASISTYINSEIACCSDYAHLFKYLLDNASIKNRLATISGHIFNEVSLNNKWLAMDSSLNILFDRSWENIYKRNKNEKFVVTIFPHQNLIKKDNDFYRPVIGSFLLSHLYNASQRTEPVTQYIHQLPKYIGDR